MTAGVRCGTLLAFLVLSLACDKPDRITLPGSTEPQPQPQPSPPTSPPPGQFPPPGGQPPLTGPSITYLFSGQLSFPVSGFTTRSRYVLYDNGAFALHYEGIQFVYVGVYRPGEDGRIYLDFDADGAVNEYSDAWGTLKDGLLEVRYNLLMQHSDFEDAAYTRSQ